MSLASKSIDVKARKRIEELYELTDEIINAYNEIDEKYVNQIYRKYKRLQNENKKLKQQLAQHHCVGCKCAVRTESNAEVVDGDDESEESSGSDEEYKQRRKTSSTAAATTDSVITRSKKTNNR